MPELRSSSPPDLNDCRHALRRTYRSSQTGHYCTMYCIDPHLQQQEAQLDALHDYGQQHDPAREGIWHLLLGQLWTPLDQAVICKLLCCSQTMANLIHTKCQGRLSVKVSGTGACPSTGVLSAPPPTSWQHHMAPGRWLAKHTRLCNSIEVTIPPAILAAAAPQPPMPGSDDCSQMDCSLLEASIAAGLTIAAQGPSLVPPVAPPVAGCWQPAQQQQEEPTQHVYYIDTETAAATLPASATAASSMGMQTADHAISFASSLLSRGFSQLRLEGLHTSTFAAVAAAVQAFPHTAAAALAGVSTDNDLGGSSGQQRQQLLLQQQQEEEGERQAGRLQLPLVSFSSNLPSDGRMLCALAGQAQLTALQLCLTSSSRPATGYGAALASLRSLWSLTLNTVQKASDVSFFGTNVPHRWQAPLNLDAELRQLTCLTHLSLSWMPGSFPTSLVSLQTGNRINELLPGYNPLELQHLTRLTHLDVRSLKANDVLPPSLRSLQVHDKLDLNVAEDPLDLWMGLPGSCVNLDQLQYVQHLHLSSHPSDISGLQQLTQLTHLGLQCSVQSVEATTAAALSTLPLRWLHLNSDNIEGAAASSKSEDILAQLGSYPQLTYLQLQLLTILSPVANLSRQLQRLPALQELQLVRLRVANPVNPATAAPGALNPAAAADPEGVLAAPGADPQAEVVVDSQGAVDSMWGPLFKAVPLLTPLRELVVAGLLPAVHDSDVDVLGGASQLTCLRVAASGISEAAAERLGQRLRTCRMACCGLSGA